MNQKRRTRIVVLMLVAGVLLIGLSVVIRGRGKQATVNRPSLVTPIVSGPFPAAPPAIASGFRIKSRDLGIDLPVVAGDGWSVAYYQAALYPGMKLPGEGGRSMIYAHALSGMFGSLRSAAIGEHIVIERPGGSTLRYTITAVEPRWPPGNLTYTKPTGHEELVLVTCTSYEANDPRILVVAAPG